jgi:hypothetical protein
VICFAGQISRPVSHLWLACFATGWFWLLNQDDSNECVGAAGWQPAAH